MFNSPTILTMYAEARIVEDRAPKRVPAAAPRLTVSFPRLRSMRSIVSIHKQTKAHVARTA